VLNNIADKWLYRPSLHSTAAKLPK